MTGHTFPRAVGHAGLVPGEQVEATATTLHHDRAQRGVLCATHGRVGPDGTAVGGNDEPSAASVLAVGVAGVLVIGEGIKKPTVVGYLGPAIASCGFSGRLQRGAALSAPRSSSKPLARTW